MGCSASSQPMPLPGGAKKAPANHSSSQPKRSARDVRDSRRPGAHAVEQYEDMLILQTAGNSVAMTSSKKLDPRLPLNERQLFSIKKSWKAIGRNMGTTAVSMFIKLFETNIDLKNQFEKFKDLKHLTDLRLAKGFDEHAMLVMCTLDEAINNLDDVPYVIDMLRKTGNTHKRFPGFVPENFYAIEEPFLLAVQEQLGDRFSFGFQVAYKRIIYFFLDTLVGGFKS